jgi:hypothetical protein
MKKPMTSGAIAPIKSLPLGKRRRSYYWDEYYTKNPPKIDPSKRGGYFTRQRELLDVLDRVSADYIINRSMSTNKLPAEIIGELVHEKIAVGM